MKFRWLALILLVFAFAPALSFAKHINVRQDVWNPTILAGPLTVCSGNYLSAGATYQNANCSDLCDLFAQIIAILYYLMGVGIWLVIPVMFLWGGITFMLSQGNPAKTSEARKSITGAFIGVAIMLCAYLIVSTFLGFLRLTGVGGFDTGACNVSGASSSTGATTTY